MYWHDCNKEPPTPEVEYEVLVLDYDIYHGTRWFQTSGKYHKEGYWDLWLDGFGWSSDSGYTPSYWIELPPFPPLPYEGPKCGYLYGDGYCSAQKNTPRCYCQGNKEKCER